MLKSIQGGRPAPENEWAAGSVASCGDFRVLEVDVGEAFVFHGTSCRHRVPPNPTPFTRVSLDFRTGVGAHFDPLWSKQGTQHDHARQAALRFDPTLEFRSCTG
jgi:hypothetical protein